VHAGVPIGGTSAGLAVLGEFVFTAMHDTAYSKETLADPYNEGVTLTSDFLHVPYLEKTITDQHFVKRDHLGRTVGFLARILQDNMSDAIRGIAVDERNAVLVDEKGDSTLVGEGNAYFFRPKHKPEVCQPGMPLTFSDIQVYKIDHKASFTLKDWSGSGGTWYVLSAVSGKLQSSNGSVY
jgi:cyanophycinase